MPEYDVIVLKHIVRVYCVIMWSVKEFILKHVVQIKEYCKMQEY